MLRRLARYAAAAVVGVVVIDWLAAVREQEALRYRRLLRR